MAARALRRSLHFVPGGNERMIAKALTLPADGLILDLEDAVAPDRKAATRPIVRGWLERLDFGGRERWVRMNPIYSEHGETDLEETIAGRPHGYVVPKPRHAADIRRGRARAWTSWSSATACRPARPASSSSPPRRRRAC